MNISRAHFQLSVHFKTRERMYVEAGENVELKYLPELQLLEIKDTSTKEVTLATIFNIKYMIPVTNEANEQVSSSKSSKRA